MDRTMADRDGIELDAALIERLLEEGDAYSRRIAEFAQFIHQYHPLFRQILLNLGLIHQSEPRNDGFELAAVDGASATTPHGAGALIVAAAYKATLNDERQRGDARIIQVPNSQDNEAFATLLRLHLEMSLLADDKLDEDKLVILDHSFWGVMQAISRALATYKGQRQQAIAMGLDIERNAMLQMWKELFVETLGNTGSFSHMIRNKQVISLSKTGISQYFAKRMTQLLSLNAEKERIASALNDRALLRHVLQPGEFTAPQSIYHTVQEGGKVQSWKRGRFATKFENTEDGPDPFVARERVFDEFGLPRDDGKELVGRRLFITYFRPYSFSRVYRIEFHETLLGSLNGIFDVTGHSDRFQRTLASIKKSVNIETKEPLSQVLADIRAKTATASAATLIPERTFYQLRNQYRDNTELLEILDTLTAEERT